MQTKRCPFAKFMAHHKRKGVIAHSAAQKIHQTSLNLHHSIATSPSQHRIKNTPNEVQKMPKILHQFIKYTTFLLLVQNKPKIY